MKIKYFDFEMRMCFLGILAIILPLSNKIISANAPSQEPLHE